MISCQMRLADGLSLQGLDISILIPHGEVGVPNRKQDFAGILVEWINHELDASAVKKAQAQARAGGGNVGPSL